MALFACPDMRTMPRDSWGAMNMPIPVRPIRSKLRSAGRLSIAMLALVVGLMAGSGSTFAAQTSPAGHNQSVIAQGITALPDGEASWRVVHATADPDTYAQAIERAAGFVVADQGSFLVTDQESGVTAKLDGRDPGTGSAEAAFVGVGAHQSRISLPDQEATPSYFDISLSGAGDGAIGDAFDAPDGTYELVLIQGDVSKADATTIHASASPVLLVATAGDLSVTQQGGVDGVLAAQQAVLLAPGAETTVQGEGGDASYVAAMIGDAVETVTTATPEPTPEPSVPEATSVPPAPTEIPVFDSDADGLNDSDEALYGTDPGNPDSDGDGLLDGTEVFQLGTSPMSMDTDGDSLLDGDEVGIYGTSPSSADTDGDGVLDGDEINNGTDPFDPAVVLGPSKASSPFRRRREPGCWIARDRSVPGRALRPRNRRSTPGRAIRTRSGPPTPARARREGGSTRRSRVESDGQEKRIRLHFSSRTQVLLRRHCRPEADSEKRDRRSGQRSWTSPARLPAWSARPAPGSLALVCRRAAGRVAGLPAPRIGTRRHAREGDQRGLFPWLSRPRPRAHQRVRCIRRE